MNRFDPKSPLGGGFGKSIVFVLLALAAITGLLLGALASRVLSKNYWTLFYVLAGLTLVSSIAGGIVIGRVNQSRFQQDDN